MNISDIQKSFLRRHYRLAIQRERANNSYKDEQIVNFLFDLLIELSKSTVGIYYPIEYEIDVLSLSQRLDGIKFALPKVRNRRMVYVEYAKGDRLVPNAYGICEPESDNEINPEVIIVPGLAFDLNGYRLGRGKGYYDRYIASRRDELISIGVCRQYQILELLPHNQEDYPMSYIVSELMSLDINAK